MKEIHTALASFQGAVGNIDLDAEVKVTTKAGGAYTFKYATLGAIRDAIRAPLKEAGLSVVQTIEADQFVTLVTHTSGQQITSTLPFKGVWQTAQEFGSLVTYYRRYGLVTTLGLVAAEDDDANIADQNTVEEKKEASKRSDFIRSESYHEARGEMAIKGKLRAKEEVKELTIEGLNLLKFQIKLKELEYKLTNNQV